jgi:hypothetical protein
MEVTKSTTFVDAQNRTYQKVCIQGDDVCYVAIEAKVYKYDHVLHFAKFLVKNKVASMVAGKSLNVSYEYSDTLVDTTFILESEMNAMLPPGCERVIRSDVDDNEDPQKMFEYEFDSHASKRTQIILHARPDGDGGHVCDVKQYIMLIDPENPFGPTIGNIIV